MRDIALQLYTVRDALHNDFSGTLHRIAEMGYRHVETAFLPPGVTVPDAARLIREAGLQVMAAHVEMPLGGAQSAVLALADAYGCDTIIWHGWPRAAEYDTIEGTKRLAEQYNAANRVASAAGLRFGIHNHWWEFETPRDESNGDGVSVDFRYQILRSEMDPDIFFELDVYWATVAGRDSVQLLHELGPRVPIVHVKDGPLVHGQPMVAAGQGALNLAAILDAATDAEYLVVELDECDGDMMNAVADSLRYLATGI